MPKSKYEDRIISLEKKVFAKPRAWYKEPGIWFAILCTLVAIYLVYLFILSEAGYKLGVVPWLKPWTDQILDSIKLWMPASQIQ